MYNFKSLHQKLIEGEIKVNDLIDYKHYFSGFNFKDLYEAGQMEAYIMLALDFYVYSDNGQVLIDDVSYDQCMSYWCNKGNKQLVYPDNFDNITQWELVRHEHPELVGSLSKIYDTDELIQYLDNLGKDKNVILAPKYDGVSCAIKVEDHRIVKAITRGDGIIGQDITRLIQRASNTEVVTSCEGTVYFKCELLVSKKNFEKLIKEKKYSNRRSATSGIVNSPKNIDLGRFITIMPLIQFITSGDYPLINYVAEGQIFFSSSNAWNVYEYIQKMLKYIRSSEFEFRTDGVVIFPNNTAFNDKDLMADSVAYKINTAKGYTRIDYAYISMGRKGYAVPMLHVEPVDVNETMVTDVSLGSFDKFDLMGLREGEIVEVFSAGDVIPQAKALPDDERIYVEKSKPIKLKKRCPYCNEKLTRYGGIYRCDNPSCVRIKTGKITSFLVNMNVKNIGDATIESLYNAGLIKNIQSLFYLRIKDIIELDGFDITSADYIVKSIDEIRNTPVSPAKLFGSLSIPKIEEKKCKKIFDVITLKELLTNNPEKLRDRLMCAEGIGGTTADTFINYVKSNYELIEFLVSVMTIDTNVKKYKYNVVFTGFRDSALEKRFNDCDVEVSDSINSSTIAVICASLNSNSGKVKKALKKGISIVHISEVEEIFDALKSK